MQTSRRFKYFRKKSEEVDTRLSHTFVYVFKYTFVYVINAISNPCIYSNYSGV